MKDKVEIFVGIPCYNTGEKLLVTLNSLQQQRYKNFKAVIGVEPTETAARTIEIAHFIAKNDNRFRVIINEERLGWAGNIKQLMQKIDCPYFTILPHDDVLHEEYLHFLLQGLLENPDSIVAFPSVYFFGQCDGLHLAPEHQTALPERLINHFASGESSEFWRGLTRSTVLDSHMDFPSSGPESFAAEYEWAAMLLILGKSLYVKDAYYFKRIHPSDAEDSVSTEWSHRYGAEKLLSSLAEHKTRMTSLITASPLNASDRDKVLLAFNTAYLWKILHFSQGRFPYSETELALLKELKTRCASISNSQTTGIQHRLLLCEVWHEYFLNHLYSIEEKLAPVIEADPQNLDAHILLMKTCLRQNDMMKALNQLNVLTAKFPNSWRIREVTNWLADNLNHTFHYE